MVDIEITSKEFIIRPRGLHKLWAFKWEVRIPRRQLTRVEAGVTPDARSRLSRSLRIPGTFVPALIAAGSFRFNGKWAFWDVVGKGANALTLSTEGHRYAELIVDVREPGLSFDAVQRAIRSA